LPNICPTRIPPITTNDDAEAFLAHDLSSPGYRTRGAPGGAVVISHGRFFLDHICTHMLAFEGNAHVEWFEGNFEDYEADKIRRLGPDAVEPKRIKYKKSAR
jgi:hypothetical protein